MIQAITFFLLTIVLIGSAICIVLKKNLFHAALILMLFLFAMAAMYIHLKAELIGVIQVLAYVGGVTTFILFVIMLTAKITDKSEERFNKQRILSIVVMAVVFISFVSLSVHLSSKKMDYFSEGPQTWVKINENTIKDLKNKITEDKLKIIKSLRNKEFSIDLMTDTLKASGFNQMEIDIVMKYAVTQNEGITIIGKLLLSDYVLSFELISVILTVTMIGAIILVKKEESPCL